MNNVMLIIVCMVACVIITTYVYTFLKDKKNISSFMAMITEMMPKIIDLFNGYVKTSEDYLEETDPEIKKDIALNYVTNNIILAINNLDISDEIKKVSTLDNVKPLIRPIINKLSEDLEVQKNLNHTIASLRKPE